MNRQVKVLNAIMANWDIVKETIDDANNSMGAALEGNEKYMDSIEGRINAFKSAFQNLSRTTISSDFVKGLVGAGTDIVNFTTSIGGLIPVLVSLSGVLIAFKSLKIADGLKGIGKSLTSKGLSGGISKVGLLITGLTMLVTTYKKVRGNLDGFNILEGSKRKYQDSISGIADTQTKLKSVQEQIQGIQSLGDLSFVQQQELAKLKETSAELELQYDLQKKMIGLQKGKFEGDFVSLLGSYDKMSSGYYGIDAINKIEESIAKFFSKIGVGDALGTLGIDISDWGKPDKLLFTEAVDAFIEGQSQVTEQNKTIFDLLKQNGFEAGMFESFLGQDVEERAQANLDAYQNINKAIEIYNKYKEASEGIERNKNTEPYFQLLDQMETRLQDAMDYAKRLEDAMIVPFGQIFNSPEFTEMSTIIRNLAESGALTNDTFSNVEGVEAFTNAIGYLGITADEAVDYINQLYQTDSMATITTNAEAAGMTLQQLYDSLIHNSTGYEALEKAIAEQDKAGVLSYETWNKLLEAMPEMGEYLTLTADGYALNAESVYDYIKSQEQEQKLKATEAIYDRQKALEDLQTAQENLTDAEAINANQANQDRILTEIDQYEALIREIEAATGALARYQAAKSTKNQDADFNEGESAYKDIQEGLKTGKIGTDDFKTAVDFVLGNNWQNDLKRFPDGVEQAYKEADRLGKRYFGQKEETKGMENFMEDDTRKRKSDGNQPSYSS